MPSFAADGDPLARCRDDFPILQTRIEGHPLAYLDNAATAQQPLPVTTAFARYHAEAHANVHRSPHTLAGRATAAYEAARERTARFLHAGSADEIIFTRGTTESLNLVAQSWGETFLHPGDRVVVTEMEHHSNLVPWQRLARRRRLELALAPVRPGDGALDLAATARLLTPPTKLLACAHISNVLGAVNPVDELCALARACGAVSVIDAAQSAGHRTLDVRAMGCDFLAFSGHKMCGPTGIGVLYGRAELLARMPPWQTGGEMVEAVRARDADFMPPPLRFEAGTPHIAGAVGLRAAMDYLDGIGRDRIGLHDQTLAAYACDRLREINGLKLVGPGHNRAGLVTFHLPDAQAHDVALFADARGIAVRAGHHCAMPLAARLNLPATVRASFYLYNTRAEVDRLVEAVRAARDFYRT